MRVNPPVHSQQLFGKIILKLHPVFCHSANPSLLRSGWNDGQEAVAPVSNRVQ